MTANKAGRRYLALLGVIAGVISGVGGTAAVQASHGTQKTLVAHMAGSIAPGLDFTVPTPFSLFKSSNPAANGGHPASYAWGVATLPDGTIAVTDIFNNRVLHYDTSGNLLGVLFTTNGKNGANPYGIAVDPNDWTIYVGSAQCCGVQVYTTPTTGSTLSYTYKDTIDPTGGATSTTSRYPARMAVGSDGTVYIADMTLDTLSVFTSQATGNVKQAQFGGYGTGNAQFKQPRGMAIGGGGTTGNPQRLYVIDSGNYRVEVYDTTQMVTNTTTHGYLYSFGSQLPAGASAFGGNLRGIAYDQVNNVAYVVDMGKNHVEEWSINPNATSASQDAWVQNIGVADPNNATNTTCCAKPGDFSDGGREDAVDGLGQLWVADMPNFRAQVWSTSTSGKKPTSTFLFDAPSATSPQLGAAGAFSYPEGVGVAADGTIVVSDSHNFRLEWFDSASSSTPYAFDSTGAVNGTGQEGLRGRQNDYSLNYSRNISFNTNAASPALGDFYLADTYNNSVHGFAENGTALWVYGGNGTGSIDGPAVADGPMITNTSVKSPLALPSGVAVDNSNGPNQGDIYIADSGDKRVVVISPAGTFLGLISAGTGAGQAPFKDPRGLAVDPSNGDLYVADFSGKSIYHFTISGTWAATGPTATVTLAGTITGGMATPFDVVVDAANSAIYVSDTSGIGGKPDILGFSTAAGNASLGSFLISGQPEGLALGPNDDLYVASRSNDQIQVFCNPVTGVC
jgi:tripartite motif-containing protein 71